MAKLPKNKRSYVRIFKDEDSSTLISAAVLIKNIQPSKKAGGYYHIANAQFKGGFYLNCDGYKVRPNVEVRIWCELPKNLSEQVSKNKRRERAIAKSPMLF